MTIHERIGTATFVDPHTIETPDGRGFHADRFILSAGGTSRRLPVPGFDLTSTHSDAWALTEVPASMLVVGGGATGVQVASIFNAFGTQVGYMTGGAMCFGVWLGDELGLHRVLADIGPATADDLADLVRSGEYEAIYGNMPPQGLGKATKLVRVAESVSARQRI